MLKSMTAFARGKASGALGQFSAQVQLVNRRFLDINLFLPQSLAPLEGEIRKRVAQVISRGQVTVSLSVAYDASAALSIVPDLALVRGLKEAWHAIAREVGAPDLQVHDLKLYADQKGLFAYPEDENRSSKVSADLFRALDQALRACEEMRLHEGAVLQKDIAERLNRVEALMQKVEAQEAGSVEKQRKKLSQRLEGLISGLEEAVAREIVIFADKIDITEELVRARSHLQQCRELFHASDATGKKLEFLTQELLREMNTMGAKAFEASSKQLTIDARVELERIREQLQNVE